MNSVAKGKVKTIAIVGLHDDQNLGDPIITESVEYLYSLYDSDYILKRVNLEGYKKINMFFYRALMKFGRTFNISPSRFYKRQAYLFYKEQLKDVDALLFSGGGIIKFIGQYFYGLEAAIKVAFEYRIPVALNAVGVEGYDAENKKCLSIVNSLKYENVKYISTRDDLDTLRNFYVNERIVTEKVADPAVWISEKYGITKDGHSDKLGIGVGDFSLFTRYNSGISQDRIKQFYVDTICELLNEKFDVVIFTNGLSTDDFAAKQVQDLVETKTGIHVESVTPSNCEELVKIVASFKAIIATRMHTCIVAYSLNIPTIGIVWNKKLSLFGQNIGASNYYLHNDEIEPEIAINRMKLAINNGYNMKLRDSFRNTVKDGICHIVSIFNE